MQTRSIAHGVIALEQSMQEYGVESRRLHIIKLRGVKFRGGLHDYVIERGGIIVFPRLYNNSANTGPQVLKQASSGLDRLETGRASCRESGCRDGKNWGGA